MNNQLIQATCSSVYSRLTRQEHIFQSRTYSNMVKKMLEANPDFSSLGSGSYGEVVKVKDGIAMKICRVKESGAYLAYVRYCRRHAHHNPLLPRIFRVSTYRGFAMVFMEMLKSPWSKEESKIKKTCQLIKHVCKKGKHLATYHSALHESQKSFRIPKSKVEGLRETLNKIISTPYKDGKFQVFLDMHEGNVMMRQEGNRRTIVLIDPIAS